MAIWLTVVGIANGRDFGIDIGHGNYPTKSKLALYKALICCNSC